MDERPLTKSGPQLRSQFIKYLDPEINRQVDFKVLRGSQTKVITCKLLELPEPKEFKAEDIDLTVRNITDLEYHERGLTRKNGVVVTSVIPGSPAATAESAREYLIYTNDIIVSFASQATPSWDEFIKAVQNVRREKQEVVLVKIWRGSYFTHEALNLRIGRK